MKRQKVFLISWVAAITAIPVIVSAVPFTSGNMVVVRTGDATYPSDTSAGPVYLDEYTLSGMLVQSIPMGDYTDTVNPQFTLDGGNRQTGFISRSYNGQYLAMGGYNAPLGMASVASSSSTTYQRTVARIDLNGNIDTSTRITDVSSNEIRSVASYDGSQFWESGTGNSNQCRYALLGATTSTRIPTSSNFNVKTLNVFQDAVGDPQLYSSRGSSANCVNTVFHAIDPVPKLPTTTHSSSNPVLVTPLFTESGASTYDFFFLDDSTLYRTDDNNTANGGIVKYTRSGSTWTKQYVLQTGLSYVPLRGLTGCRNGAGDPVLFATDGNSAHLVMVRDLGPTSSFLTIASATGNMLFHDVALPYGTPEPASLFLLGLGGLFCLRRRCRV